MADYFTPRRPNRFTDGYEPSDEVSRPRDHASDPLAELARLIGRSEQYSGAKGPASPAPSRPTYRDAEPGYGDRDPAQRDVGSRLPPRLTEPAREYEPYPHEVPIAREPRLEREPRLDQWEREQLADFANRSSRYEAEQFAGYADRPEARTYQSEQSEQGSELEEDGRQDYELDSHAGEQDHYEADHEQFYDDPPRAHRHSGLLTAIALVGCAILGTAGAYAYRSYAGHASATQPARVITADTSSTKIVPATANDPQSGKPVQDRIANAGKEQIVSKQEEPVALKDIGTPTTPRVVLPAPVTPAPPAASAQGSTGTGALSNEPKKVRTLTIRSDGNDSRPVGAPAQSGAGRAGATSSRTGNEPLSLEPQRDQATEQGSEAPARIRTATAPAASASRSTSTGSTGGLMVQLSSHKSESDALASFRSLQSRFPDELGGRQGVVRRADLGAKGVFYRAMVGPFASAQEANQFCANLKSAGGSCVVPSQ
jgi:hypothetical protein